MDSSEFKRWEKHMMTDKGHWKVDKIHNKKNDFLVYATHPSDHTSGIYVSIKNGVLESGKFEDAVPHIGDASFHSKVKKTFPNSDKALTYAIESLGMQFLLAITHGTGPYRSVNEKSEPFKFNKSEFGINDWVEVEYMGYKPVKGKIIGFVGDSMRLYSLLTKRVLKYDTKKINSIKKIDTPTRHMAFESSLNEKSVSKSQQRLMGMVHATQKGEIKPPSKKVAKMAKSMKKSDVEDFAKTKHKNLPEKVKESFMPLRKNKNVSLISIYKSIKNK